jgi:hypothetical protein
MDRRDYENIEEAGKRMAGDAIKNTSGESSPPPLVDIAFAEAPHGFEIYYSDRLADDYPELVDQSADWLENEMGVLNLGQIDHKILLADGILTDQIKNGLIAWWTERVEDLDFA